eukprot:gene13700-24792_t
MVQPGLWRSRRGAVVLSLMLCNVICYLDRTNISVAVVPMAEQYGWDSVQQGNVLGSFFWGYASTQIIGGKLCSRYGGAPVLIAAVLGWSICTILTPIAASTSMPALILCRVLMGAGEGMSQPAIHTLVASWIPKAERTQAIAVASSGMISGTVLSMMSAGVV